MRIKFLGRLLTIAAVCGFMANTLAGPQAGASVDKGLVGYWSFDDVGVVNGRAIDRSGNQ